MDRRWLPAGVLALASVVAGVWWGRGLAAPPAPAEPMAAATPPTSSPSGDVVVHVSGWVNQPGLVTVPDGSRIGDVLAEAGGVRPGATLDSVNLAQPVADGQQVVVPGPDAPASGIESAVGDGLVHLNTATAADLEALPGVGPVLAERIIAHREARGGFAQVEDLLEVPGIGEAKLADLRDVVVVP